MKWRRRWILPPPEQAVQSRNARRRLPHAHAIHSGSKIFPVAPQLLQPIKGNVRLEYRSTQNQTVNAMRMIRMTMGRSTSVTPRSVGKGADAASDPKGVKNQTRRPLVPRAGVEPATPGF